MAGQPPARFTASGKRERHFFKKKTEADEFARRQRIRVESYGSSASVLPAGRVEEAAIAFERLAPLGVTLTEVVDEFIARRDKETWSVPFPEAFRRFEEHKPKRRSEAYRQQLAYTLRKFTPLHDTLVTSIVREDIEGSLSGAPPSARNAFLRVLSAVFNYCIKREWLETNPVQKIDRADVDRGAIEVLPLEKVHELLSACLELGRVKELTQMFENPKARFADLSAEEKAEFSMMTGKGADGAALDGHQHANFWLLPDESGKPTRLVCYRSEPFSPLEYDALQSASESPIAWEFGNLTGNCGLSHSHQKPRSRTRSSRNRGCGKLSAPTSRRVTCSGGAERRRPGIS